MANYVINAGTYTDFNFRTLSNIVLIGQIVVQGNFEIRSAGYIDCSQATILATDTSGSIVLQASGVHPDYPGYALTIGSPGVYCPHAFGAAILLGPIIASGYTLSLLSGMQDPDEPGVIIGTSAYGPNGTRVQITANFIKTSSIGVWSGSGGTNNGVPQFTSQQVTYSSLAFDYNRTMTTAGVGYRVNVSTTFGFANFIEVVSPTRVLVQKLDFINTARQVPWNGDPTSIPYTGFTVGIKLSDVAEYFGDTGSNSLQEFYRGGGLVPGITPTDGISVPRNINTSVPESGEIGLSDFFGAKRWTNSYTTYTDPNISPFVIWYPNGPTDEGPVPGPLVALYLNNVFATSTYFFGQFGMSIPATITHSGITYNINPVAYEEDIRESGLYSSSHVATAT